MQWWVNSITLDPKKEIIPSNPEPTKPTPKAANRHSNQDSKPNRTSILFKQIAPSFYSRKSCLCFSEQNRARVWESLFFFNRPSASFLPHRTAIGLLWSKSRLGEHVFGCAKAIHLHLWINLLFVRYFPHFFSCFFLFVHQFICPKLKN